MLALPIFPVSRPTSIFGGSELNFCVRYGNRWTLTPINTNDFKAYTLKTEHCVSALLRKHFPLSLLFQNCRSSPRLISTSQLHTLLRFHLWPINDIVYVEPYSSKDERSYLRESFTLRCLQRLSRPYIATQLCPWQDNWCTRGTSIPVLSY